MKRTIIGQAVSATLVGLVVVGFTNTARSQHGYETQKQCSVESKEEYYRDFLASYAGASRDQAKAVESAKKYLACPNHFSDQEEVRANLSLAVGRVLSLKNPTDAISYLLKAATYDSLLKASPQLYADLAEAYEEGPYLTLSDAYRARFEGKDETEESLLALENIYPIVDRIIDAYARALALAGFVEPPKRALGDWDMTTGRSPTDWFDSLTVFYRFRHNGSEVGLKTLIATVLSQPLPSEPIPITSVPPRKNKNP